MKSRKKRSEKKGKKRQGEEKRKGIRRKILVLDVGTDNFHILPVVQGCQGLFPLFPAKRSSSAGGKDKVGWGAWEQGSDLHKYLL